MAQASIDSSSLASDIAKNNASIDATVAAINEANAQIGSLGNVRAQATIDAANADITVKTTDALGKLKAQQNALKAATVIGTNMDDASELVTSLGMEARVKFEEAAKARDEYFKTKNTDFFSDPLGAIINIITGASSTAHNQYSKAAMDYNAAVERLDTIANQTTAHATAQAAIAQTITAGSVEALGTQIALNATKDAAQIKQQNLLYNIQGLEAVMKMDSQKLDNSFKLSQAVMSEKHLAIAQAQLRLSAASHQLALDEKLQRIQDRKESREGIESIGDMVNVGRASMGLPPIPANKSIQMMQMKGESGEAIRHQYEVGANQADTGKPIIADNAGKAARFVAQTGAPLAPAAAPIKKVLLSALENTYKNRSVDRKDTNAVDRTATELVKGITETMARNIDPADNANIYQAPDMGTLATQESVKNSVFYQKVLAPAVSTGVIREINPTLIISQATNAIATKQVSFEDAVAGVNTLFKAATEVNNKNKDYMRYGVALQTSYITAIENTPGFAFGGTPKIDMTTSVGVSNAISKRLSAQQQTMNLNSPANKRF